jgi:hypothetical protein
MANKNAQREHKPTQNTRRPRPTKQQFIVIVASVVIIVVGTIYWFVNRNKDTPHTPNPYLMQAQVDANQNKRYYSTSEIETLIQNALEDYLYMATLKSYQIATVAGAGTGEYRDYEQKYAEYRTFRDARMKRQLEQQAR